MERKPYSTDLTDAQWEILAPLLPEAKPGGRPRSVELREVVNAILYLLRSGCPWRMLPHDLPPWQTSYKCFRNWTRDGTWERLHEALRPRFGRLRAGTRNPPELVEGAAIIGSQNVKTTEKGTSGLRCPQEGLRKKAAYHRRHYGTVAGRCRTPG